MALSDLCEGDRRELRQQARAAIAALQPGLDGNGPLDAILYERERHEQAKRDGKFSKTCADDMTDRERLPVLMEEVGEVARAMLEGDGPNLREELAQVGAVALAWIEGLDAAALTEKENDR
jgi:NTP pyrophosphatase (non-canonical NTP hydrolase)